MWFAGKVSVAERPTSLDVSRSKLCCPCSMCGLDVRFSLSLLPFSLSMLPFFPSPVCLGDESIGRSIVNDLRKIVFPSVGHYIGL